MIEVPYVNLCEHWNEEKKDLIEIFEDVMSSGIFVGGPLVDSFEKKLEDYSGAKHAVSLNSGTDALILAMQALGIGPGDEVITPPNSFIASTAAIVQIGAKPVFVDVLPDQSINPMSIQSAITKKTKAIMPVHLTGRMAKMDEINTLADDNGIAVVEDAAQAIGSEFKGVKSGRYGVVGCFSTHPLKNLNACGDGGFILTDNCELAEHVRSMRNHGMIDRNTVGNFGLVSRMDAMQAAILSYRLLHLDDVINRRRRNARLYRKILNQDYVYIPEDTKEYKNSYHTFVVQVENRSKLVEYLKFKNIQTAIHYPVPIHLQPAALNFGYTQGDMPVTERQASRILSLPINQFLSENQIRYVAEQINAFYEGRHNA